MTTGATLDDYREVCPAGSVDMLRRMSAKLHGRRMLHVNASRTRGGSATMLTRLVPLFEELGIDCRWEVVEGDDRFVEVCDALYNTIQGEARTFAPEMLEEFVETNRTNARRLSLEADVVVVHDHHAAPLVEYRPLEDEHWVWRCHLDISRPDRETWAFLRPYVVQYDAAVFSLSRFAHRVPIPKFLIYPSIDPLSERNRELEPEEIDRVLERLEVPRDKPILLQASRFHRLKDPLGVIDAYRIVKARDDCRLVLTGAAEGEDGERMVERVRDAAGDDPDIHVLPLPERADLEVNALQRAATIVVQKSIREGFGLMVAEAMWKGKPVIGGAVGGIPAQLVYDVTGFTVHSPEGCAFRIRQLLADPERAARMGRDAREFARRHFLITRNLGDYLALMTTLRE